MLQKPRAVWGVDIGGTKIATARVSRRGVLSGLVEIPTPSSGGYDAVEAVIHLLAEFPQKDVVGIGVGVPGLAYPNGSVWAPNIRGWKHMPLGGLLKRRFHLPALVDSDRNAFVMGEAWLGSARGCRDVVFLAVGTGIGAGILVGGRLLRGHGEKAGAVGWTALRSQIRPIFKAIGCFETLASGTGIGRTASHHFGRKLSARELTGMAPQGNRKAKALLERAGYDIGPALANLVDVLNPEFIVIGGGVAAAGELILRPARRTMMRWGQPLAVRQVKVVRSCLGARASLLGAAKLGFDYCDHLLMQRSSRKSARHE